MEKSSISLMRLSDQMKEIHDRNRSWPRHSMQQPVLSRLGAIQPPGRHSLQQDRNTLILPTTGLP